MTTLTKARLRTMRRDVIFMSALVLAMGFAVALTAERQTEALDRDGDGAVSYAELIEAEPEVGPRAFAALDADRSGHLEARELAFGRDTGILPAG